jgi:uncharacterized protein (UPF0332 family)
MKSRIDYITYKLQKADESMRAATVLLNSQLYADALTKIYYAAFHAISALLIDKNLNPKTHSGVKSLFHKEFIFTGEIDKSYAELYDTLLAKRFEADYEAFAFINEENIPSQLQQTQALIELIKDKLQYKST